MQNYYASNRLNIAIAIAIVFGTWLVFFQYLRGDGKPQLCSNQTVHRCERCEWSRATSYHTMFASEKCASEREWWGQNWSECMLFSFQISEIIMIFFSLALLLRIEIKNIVWPLAHSWSLHVAALAARAHAFMARSRLSLFLKSANSVHMIYTNVIGTLQSICRILWQQLMFGLSHDALCFNWKLNVSILYAV